MIPSSGYSQNVVQQEQALVPLIDAAIPVQKRSRYRIFCQVLRFGVVGLLNTGIDFLTYSMLVLCFPTHNTNLLIAYNTVAFLVGALNSFLFNKYWTFRQKKPVKKQEIVRFAILTGITVLCNNSILWLAATLLQPLSSRAMLWADTSKAFAVVGTAIISYIGMHLWVFSTAAAEHKLYLSDVPENTLYIDKTASENADSISDRV